MKYFKLEEFFKSATADRLGIDNHTDSPAVIVNIEALVGEVLDPLREQYGLPIYISSGYRCPRLNKAVGGSATSQHTTGQAADLIAGVGATIDDTQEMMRRLAYLCSTLDTFDQLIFEDVRRLSHTPAWVHISHRRDGGDRRQILLKYAGDRGYAAHPLNGWGAFFKQK